MKYSAIFIAYYIFCLIVLFGTGYVVFILNRSGWWFLLAIIIINASPTVTTKNNN